MQVGCGFALWRLALARSRHALGHCRLAALAFIPLANLWLIVVPEQQEPGVMRRQRPSGLDAVRVVVGVGLIGAALAAMMVIDTWKRAALVVPGAFPFGTLVQFVLNRDGVEKTIELITGGPVNPEDSGIVRRLRHAAHGRELQRVNLINSDDPQLIDPADAELGKAIKGAVLTRVCTEEDLIPLLKAGATVRETYQDRVGREIETVVVKAGDCGL